MIVDLDVVFIEAKSIISHNTQRDDILEQISVLLKAKVSHYDWVGFYIMDDKKKGLVLGPFSGAKTDHTYIPVGKGVCGQVAQNKKMMVVQDVSKLDNYLSCSIDVQSEIVVPILKNGVFVAELDIDSHSQCPFTETDIKLLEDICKELAEIF